MTFGYEDRRTWRPVVQVVFDFVLYEELKFVRMNKSLSYLIVPTEQDIHSNRVYPENACNKSLKHEL